MDCKGFKRWLVFRDDCGEDTSHEAQDHRENCPGCDRLYVTDEGLEQALSAGIRPAHTPSGLARQARALTEAEARHPKTGWAVWLRQGLAPALALGVVVVFVIWNPLTHPLSSLETIGNYALANHSRADMTMAFTVDETPDPQDWFFKRLNFRVTMPDFRERGLTLRGGRECTIGPKKAAYLYYDDNGQRVSVFVMPARQINIPLQADRRYRIDAPRHQVELWKMNALVCILVQDRPAVPSSAI